MLTTDPQDEVLDIVDANNRVVGQATRAEIHRRQLAHRACHIIVFDSKQQVLVQLRSHTKDNNPGLWDSSAAGHLDAGETFSDCACRELSEELSISVPPAALEACFLLPASPLTGMEFAQVYKLVTDQQPVAEPTEVADLVWCPRLALDQWMLEEQDRFTDVFREIWRRLATGAD